MMRITATETRKRRYSLEVVGHAASREACAAVSAIVVALQGWAENAVETWNRRIEVKDGEALIDWRGSYQDRPVWLMAVIGLQAIAARYSDIEIDIKESTT